MSALRRLAAAHGILPDYHDIRGTLHTVTDETLVALLAAVGVDASGESKAESALARHEASRWRTPLEPLVIVRDELPCWRIRLRLPAAIPWSSLRVRLVAESGEVDEAPLDAPRVVGEGDVDGEPMVELETELAMRAPLGYHRLDILSRDDSVAQASLAVAPIRCHRPRALQQGGRTFGAAVQLYGVRSHRNWGIGDFTDLAALCERFGARGAGVVGVSPLHALFPHNPAHASPYSPSSRLFVNALYLDVEAIEDFAACAPARALVRSPAFAARLAALRESADVDYPGVAAAKRQVLELLFASFREHHLRRNTARARAFAMYRRQQGEILARHALHEALQEYCFASDHAAWGWPAWPERYRHPGAPAVTAFAETHRDRVDFFAYLQWQAELQRAAVARRARDSGLAVGLYADLAVSIDRGGAESWTWQDLYASASVGAPPDAFNPEGQNWGLPPLVPSRLAAAGFAPFIATLRASMRHAGALRIDHVMGLMRLFWVPEGSTPAHGAYVRYPFDELLALLALESHRHRCLVVGEDLGTVPDDVRHALAEHDVLSYRVLLFERDAADAFKSPDRYPERALATASTHDLPTLAGWWEGRDIDVRASLRLIDAAERERQQWARGEDRARLLRALASAGELPPGTRADPDAWPTMTVTLATAIQSYLAATPSALVIVQLEDMLLVREQANLPGTVDEHPNWRRKLPEAIEDACGSQAFRALTQRLRDARPPPEAA